MRGCRFAGGVFAQSLAGGNGRGYGIAVSVPHPIKNVMVCGFSENAFRYRRAHCGVLGCSCFIRDSFVIALVVIEVSSIACDRTYL